jgi:hypothetical protein
VLTGAESAVKIDADEALISADEHRSCPNSKPSQQQDQGTLDNQNY